MEEAVADGVGQGRLAEVVVPLGRRELAGDDGRAGAVAVLEDLEQVAPLLILDGGEAPVVDDEDVDAGELGEQADVGAVGAGEGELVEEAGGAAVVARGSPCGRPGAARAQATKLFPVPVAPVTRTLLVLLRPSGRWRAGG